VAAGALFSFLPLPFPYALSSDPTSRSDTYPYIEIDEDDVKIGHEAQRSLPIFFFSLFSSPQEPGLSRAGRHPDRRPASSSPGQGAEMEYAVEMNKLIQLQRNCALLLPPFSFFPPP